MSTPTPRPVGGSAAGNGIVALVLTAVALVLALPLILVPYVGFLPALLAGTGVVIAWSGLRRNDHGTGVAMTGLIVSAVFFVLLAGAAAIWNLLVAEPALRDYEELHEVVDYIRSHLPGS